MQVADSVSAHASQQAIAVGAPLDLAGGQSSAPGWA